MDTLLQDIRYGVRMLLKNPGFTIVAVLTLALAIGANTAIFSVINALVLKALPVQDHGALVVLGDPSRIHSRSGGTPSTAIFSYPLFTALRDGNQVFAGMFASGDPRRMRITLNNGGNEREEPLRGRIVTGEYFNILGVHAAMGRVISPQEADLANPSPVAVISHNYWKRKFASNPNIVGQIVRLNSVPVTIIGVMEKNFQGEITGESQDIWLPMSMQSQILPGKEWVESPRVSWLQLMGRLKPGVTPEQAKASINVLFKQLVNGPYGASVPYDDREEIADYNIDVQPGGHGFSWARKQFLKPMVLLMCIVGLVLLIACTNISNMLLARSSARRKEIALRLAIGAAPIRVVRQLLTESILLALLGGIVGIVVAQWGTHLLLSWVGQQYSSLVLNTAPDGRVLAFTAALCILTGILFGVVPAFRALRTELTPSLEPSSRMSAGGHRGLFSTGNLLVTGQLAVSLLVLFMAGLLVRSLQNIQEIDFGYSRDNLIMVKTDPLSVGYKAERLQQLAVELADGLSSLPGISSVSVSENGLFSGSSSDTGIKVEGQTLEREEDSNAAFDQVGPHYFSTTGIPIVRGRPIGPADTAASQPVMVINESLATFYFKDANPIGRKVYLQGDEYKHRPPYEIIGVSRNARDLSLREEVGRHFYVPLSQPVVPPNVLNISIRSTADPATVMEAIRARMRSIDPGLPITGVNTVNDLAFRTVFAESMMAKLAALFGAVALLLSAVGIYGLMSYLVVSRTREIGIRMALGAQRSQILVSILRQSLTLTAVGVVVGVPIAMLGTQALRAVLYGVGFVDPPSLLIAVALLGTVTLLAGFVPARTATKVDPMVALRYE